MREAMADWEFVSFGGQHQRSGEYNETAAGV